MSLTMNTTNGASTSDAQGQRYLDADREEHEPQLLDLLDEGTEIADIPWEALVVKVTPELADRWLQESETVNRKTDVQHVARLGQSMRDGTYQTTPQGISFSSHGDLIDGHHRLSAIRQSGVSQALVVFFGVNPASFVVFDSVAKPRSLGDIVKTAGISDKHTATVAATYKLHASWLANKVSSGAAAHMSAAQLVTAHDNHPGLISFVSDSARIASKRRVPAAALAVAAYILATERPDIDSRPFWAGVEKGANLDDGSPILAFNNFVNSRRASGKTVSQTEWLLAILKSWVSWTDSKKVTILRVGRDEKRPDLKRAGGVYVAAPGDLAVIGILDLVKSGLIPSGAKLVSLNQVFAAKARVQTNGTILYDGRSFSTPSAAAFAVRGGATNGWTFWGVDMGTMGKPADLAHYRKIYSDKVRASSVTE